MTGTNRHIIHQQFLEVRTPRGDGYELQQELSRLIWEKVKPALSDLFDRFADAEELIRIDKLEVDLGNIPPGQLREVLPERLLRSVEEALYKALQRTDEQVQRMPQRQNIFEQWLSYLLTGTLPWEAAQLPEAALRQQVLEQLASDVASIRQLMAVIGRPRMGQRLVYQHPESFLARLTVILSQKTPVDLPALRRELEQLFQRRQEWLIPLAEGATSSSLQPGRVTFWRAIFSQLAKTTQEKVLPESIRQWSLQWLLPRGELSQEDFRQWKKTLWLFLKEHAGRFPELLALLKVYGMDLLLPEGETERGRSPDGKDRLEATELVEEPGTRGGKKAPQGDIDGRSAEVDEPVRLDEQYPGPKPAQEEMEPEHSLKRELEPNEFKEQLPETDISPGTPEEEADSQEPLSGAELETDIDREDSVGVAKENEEQPPVSQGEPETGNRKPGTENREPETENLPAPGEDSDQDLPPESLPRDHPEEEQEGGVTFSQLPDGTAYYVPHAGVVLLHPYLPRFFKNLGWVEQKEFVDEPARQRAIHMINWLATGEEVVPEFRLLLPKFLCDLPFDIPLIRELEWTENELEEGMALLQAVIKHWTALKKTSPDGLREGFLQREGKLEKHSGSWRLIVEKKSMDILLNQLPWGIGKIKLPWMKEMLTVEWV